MLHHSQKTFLSSGRLETMRFSLSVCVGVFWCLTVNLTTGITDGAFLDAWCQILPDMNLQIREPTMNVPSWSQTQSSTF